MTSALARAAVRFARRRIGAGRPARHHDADGFPAFNPNAPACKAPPGLQKVLVFVQDNEREFMQGVGRGLAAAAKDRGLDYRVALANNDGAR